MIKAMNKKKPMFYFIIILSILIIGGYLATSSFKGKSSETEHDLFYILKHSATSDIDNIKLLNFVPPDTAVCISDEDKSYIINELLILESKLLSKTNDHISESRKIANRYDIYIEPKGFYPESPIQMFDNYIVYRSDLYYFEVDTTEVFNHIYNNLSNPITLEEFQKKYYLNK